MGDDFVTGGILPIDDEVADTDDFDPDAVDSDAFLDDPEEGANEYLSDSDGSVGVIKDDDEENELFEEDQ